MCLVTRMGDLLLRQAVIEALRTERTFANETMQRLNEIIDRELTPQNRGKVLDPIFDTWRNQWGRR